MFFGVLFQIPLLMVLFPCGALWGEVRDDLTLRGRRLSGITIVAIRIEGNVVSGFGKIFSAESKYMSVKRAGNAPSW